MKETLAEHDLEVSSIGSPIGKIFIDEDFAPHLERMRHAADVARFFGAPYIRIFSFFLRPGADPADHRDEVIDRMRALARVAEEAGRRSCCTRTRRTSTATCRAAAWTSSRSVGSPHLRLAWDPANFVQVGVRPYTEGYAVLRPHLEYVQIKDALARGRLGGAPPARATARWSQTIRALRHDGFDGFFSLEPHLGAAPRPAASPARSCSAAPGRPSRPSEDRGDRVRMSRRLTADGSFALVGAGVIGKHHGTVISQLADRIELVAVADSSPNGPSGWPPSAAASRSRTLTDALAADDIDVVVVCTPTGRHGEVAIEALAAGKHVIIEKPAEITVARTDEIIEAQQNGRHAGDGHLPAPLRPGHRGHPGRHRATASSAGSPPASPRSTGGAARATTTPATGGAPGSSTAAAR